MNSVGPSSRYPTWLALALPILSLLLMLFLRPLAVPDEGRYADVARLMVVNQDYVVPKLNGLPFFHKPPMLYWFESAAFKLFGIHDWAARLAPAMHGILLLLGLHLFNRKLFNVEFANRCSLLLGGSLPWLLGSQYINHDMVVACWISLTILAFAAGLELKNVNLMRIGFITAAFGVLSKGLIGIVLPGMVLFFWIAFTQQWRKLLTVPWFSGILLLLLAGLPWFVLMEQRHPGFFNYFFVEQQFNRYTGKNFNNVQPWWFYWVLMLLLFLPFSLFVFSRPNGENKQIKSISVLCICWIVAILGFFSLPASKLVGYALPVIAPAAVLISINMEKMLHSKIGSRVFLFATLLMVVVFASLVIKPPHDTANYLRAGAGIVAILWLVAALNWRAKLMLMPYAVAWIASGFLATLWTGHITLRENSTALQSSFRCYFKPGDQIVMRDEYLYDLPFYLNLPTPITVYDDWEAIAQDNNDNWAHELLDAGKFDSAMNEKVLKPLSAMDEIAIDQPNLWLVAVPATAARADIKAKFTLVADHGNWQLLRPKGAPALPPCPPR